MSTSKLVDTKHTLRKFRKYLALVGTKRVRAFRSVGDFLVCRNATASHARPSALPYDWENATVGDGFDLGETRGDWFAFRGALGAPDGFDPAEHFLRFDFVLERNYLVRRWDDDFPAGPEGRFWLDGVPIAAIDEFHDGAVIRSGGDVEVRIFAGRCRARHRLTRFGVSCYHKKTESLYQRLRFLLSVLKELSDDNPDRVRIIRVIDGAVRLLDIRDLSDVIPLPELRVHDVSGDSFYASVDRALAFLKAEMGKLPARDGNDPAISVVGYSHIDTCWQWTYGLSHFKSANTALSMIHLMDNPPFEFAESGVMWKFLATSAQHYKWMKEDVPDIYEKVMQKIRDGRWDVNGVTWIETDVTNPNGESLVRQILKGVRFLEQETGQKQTVLFLPDCFGFSGNLPQIMQKAGIDSFVTSKISWCEYTQFPHSTFLWRGIDGTDVFAHFITTPSSWSYQTATYTGVSTAYEMIGTYKQYKQKDILPTSALHTSGNGDGGGGITEEMIWNLNLMNELPKINGVPSVIFPKIEDVFVDIRKKRDELPVWDDELYLEYHRGTFTTQEEVKRINRILEANLHSVEWLIVVISSIYKTDYSKILQEIDEIWEKALLFQFHDAVTGTSINEANQDIINKSKKAIQKLKEITVILTQELSSHIRTPLQENPVILINTIGHERIICEQSIPSGGWCVKNDDTVIQNDDSITTTYEALIDNNYAVHTHEYSFVESSAPKYCSKKVNIDPKTKTVTTPFLFVSFNDNGLISSIKDIKTQREYLSGPANLFKLYEDRSINWPAWDIQLYHKEMEIESPIFDGYEFYNDSIVLNYHISTVDNSKATTIKQIVTFSSMDSFIDFKTLVNWTQQNKLLKVSFPTTIRSRNARYGIQFGNIQRPTHSNTLRDLAKFEVYGRWADLSDGTGGVSLTCDVKSGYDIHESEIQISLLKAPLQTDKWADYGNRKFTYRLYIHNTGFEDSRIIQLSDELNYPILTSNYLQPTKPIQDDCLPSIGSFVILENKNIILETLKPSYEFNNMNNYYFIARFYESIGGWGQCEVKFPFLKSSDWEIFEVDLLENVIKDKNVNIIPCPYLKFKLTFSAFELKSLMIKHKK